MSDLRQREARERDPAYMGWIAKLPCVACLATTGQLTRGVHVAHLRASSLEHGKRQTGMQEKPSDAWTTPLCPPHHVGDKTKVAFSQHSMGELDFWSRVGIDPFLLCLALKGAYENNREGGAVIAEFAAQARRSREA